MFIVLKTSIYCFAKSSAQQFSTEFIQKSLIFNKISLSKDKTLFIVFANSFPGFFDPSYKKPFLPSMIKSAAPQCFAVITGQPLQMVQLLMALVNNQFYYKIYLYFFVFQ